MPGINGIETIKKYGQRLLHQPIKFLVSFSASILESEKMEAKMAGADDFIE